MELAEKRIEETKPPKPEREWSRYQEAIFDTYENTTKNIVINATAGSGKTATIVELCNRTPDYITTLFLAYNKSIATELREKLPFWVHCETFHAMGLKVLRKNFKFKESLNVNKCYNFCKELFDKREMNQKERYKYYFNLQKLWGYIRLTLTEINEQNIEAVCVECGVDFRDSMAADLLLIQEKWRKHAASIERNWDFSMDFTDMLWIPYMFVEEDNYTKYNILMVDEANDLFPIQIELFKKYVSKKGRFVAVGDENQLIYHFLGASRETFNSIKEIKKTVSLPLSITYRCDEEIVKEARKVFEGIEPRPEAGKGIVRKGELKEAKTGDFVLCRNNLPLVKAFVHLLKEGKKSSIMGRDFGESLCSLLDKYESINDLDLLLESKAKKLIDKGATVNSLRYNPSFCALEEKVDVIKTLFNKFKGSFGSLKNKIKEIYSDEKDGIILSTIHKSKGLESDRVFFLNPELIPSKYSRTPGQLYSEECLKFVAITRARHELVYCHIDTDEEAII